MHMQEVPNTIRFVRKPSTANRAFEWLLSCVRSQMRQNVTFASFHRSTYRTNIPQVVTTFHRTYASDRLSVTMDARLLGRFIVHSAFYRNAY